MFLHFETVTMSGSGAILTVLPHISAFCVKQQHHRRCIFIFITITIAATITTIVVIVVFAWGFLAANGLEKDDSSINAKVTWKSNQCKKIGEEIR